MPGPGGCTRVPFPAAQLETNEDSGWTLSQKLQAVHFGIWPSQPSVQLFNTSCSAEQPGPASVLEQVHKNPSPHWQGLAPSSIMELFAELGLPLTIDWKDLWNWTSVLRNSTIFYAVSWESTWSSSMLGIGQLVVNSTDQPDWSYSVVCQANIKSWSAFLRVAKEKSTMNDEWFLMQHQE